MARTASQAFSWRQFRVMLRVIVRGEKSTDETGMGLGGDDAPQRRGVAGAAGAVLRKVAIAVVMVLLAAMFAMMGYGMGMLGVSPYAAFSLSAVCVVTITVLTGLYTAVNTLYFSRDLTYYLTLPLSASSVMWAKFAVFLGGALLGDLIFASIGVGCLVAHGAPAGSWVLAVVAYLLCALAVNIALMLVCVPVMRFSRLAHDKDRFSRVFGAIIVVLALGVGAGSQFALQGDGLMSLAMGADDLLSGGAPMVVLGLLCPPTLFARQVLAGGASDVVVGLCGMVVSTRLYFGFLSLMARRWYFEGVQALQGGASKRGRRVEGAELARATAARGSLATNLARDWKMMTRVPVFFNQFVLSSLLMPLYFVVILVASGFMGVSQAEDAGVDPAMLLELVRSVAATFQLGSVELVWCAVGVLGFSLLMGFSSYSFTMGVSRDGDDFFFLRALPMDWRAYLAAKFVSPYLLSTVPMLVLIVAALVALGVPAASGACLVVIYLGATATLGLLSLGLGALFPRLDWDSEAQLVKGGGATLMVFAGVVVGAVVEALPALALLAGAHWAVLPAGGALALAIALFAVECAALAWWVLGPCARRLSRLER
ncbi:putative ABC transporter permease subunit [Thermophilibacter sp.]